MSLLVAYIIVNILISVFLEKSKYRMKAATVVHAAAFSIVLILVLASAGGNALASSLSRVIGDRGYYLVSDIMAFGEIGIISPLVIIEILVPVLMMAAGAVFTAQIVENAISKRPPKRKLKNKEKQFTAPRFMAKAVNRIYRINCVMIC